MSLIVYFIIPTLVLQKQLESAKQFLQGMGYKAQQDLYELPINLSYTEAQNYIKKFKAFDKDGDGHIRQEHWLVDMHSHELSNLFW